MTLALKTAADFDAPFNIRAVAKAIDAYVVLFDVLQRQAEKAAMQPRDRDEIFSLLHPDVAFAHRRLLRSLSHDFSRAEAARLLAHPEVRARRAFMWAWMMEAETAMERTYSKTLDGQHLHKSTFFEGYVKLVEQELAQAGVSQKWPRLNVGERLAFIGAGPLPISALLMHQKTGLPVACFDSDDSAVALGRAFIDKCGHSKAVAYYQIRGENIDPSSFPCAFVAALVQDKESILQRWGEGGRRDHVLAVRAAVGLGSLLERPPSAQLMALFDASFSCPRKPLAPPFFSATWVSHGRAGEKEKLIS